MDNSNISYEEFKQQFIQNQQNQPQRDRTELVEMATIVKEPTKNKEEKEYLLCLNYLSNNGESEWTIVIGRTNAYEYIKDAVEYIDMEDSFVLVENLPLSKRITVYEFMKFAQDSYNDGFDIDEALENNRFSTENNDLEPKGNDDRFDVGSVADGEIGVIELF